MLILNDMRRGILIAAMVLVAAGCGERKQTETVLGPEETAVEFFRAVAGGDAKAAMSLCDTAAMKSYVDSYVSALNAMAKKDSCATAIAASALVNAEIKIDGNVKEGENRLVTYTVETVDGSTKKKTATVQKEGGEWKVVRITDSL